MFVPTRSVKGIAFLLLRMPSSGILRRVALVRTDFSEEPTAIIIRVTRIDEVVTTLAVASNRRCMMIEALGSSETSVLTRASRRNIPKDGILHSHRRENLKSLCSRDVVCFL
jgi:hypothetical protein